MKRWAFVKGVNCEEYYETIVIEGNQVDLVEQVGPQRIRINNSIEIVVDENIIEPPELVEDR